MPVDDVAAHYSRGNRLDRILEALRGIGKDPERLTIEDLAPVDHFHTLGPRATIDLAEAAELEDGESVLDVGCGLGGPARMIAARYGCRVTAIDITPEYCEVTRELNRRVGLQDRIVVQEANATALPFEDRSFDVVWTMHVSMNVAEKQVMYDQFARVLKQGGRLAFFDLIAGKGDPHYPVPWADDRSISHLPSEPELRLYLSTAGLHVRIWDDVTAAGAQFFAGLVPSSLGPHLLNPDMPGKMANLQRNLAEGRVRAIRSVCVFEGA
ncbi:MAG TPA: methyltransferase domain-containing protein [Actinomycetota bacterium]|nr:methyltransferase domain-containing protein [Actinomycetota bacterium]